MPPLEPDIALVLLAAGRSERFGSDKLFASFRGKALWEWAAEAAEDAGFANLYMVVAERSQLLCRKGWRPVINPHAEQGMGTSIAAGVDAGSAHRRIVIALADMPMVGPHHLRLLAEGSGTVFTRQADGTPGSPAAFGQESFAALRSLKGDRGARSLSFPEASIVDPGDRRIVLDIDTPSELARQQD
ncbi:MAG: MobA-related protein [Erythrobacter sp.]|nr:MobA-related protein [Erythrobacter sp.]